MADLFTNRKIGKTNKGVAQKFLVFPPKLGNFEDNRNVGYMMIQIYDRNSAKRLSGDKNFAVSMTGDGTASTSGSVSTENLVGAAALAATVGAGVSAIALSKNALSAGSSSRGAKLAGSNALAATAVVGAVGAVGAAVALSDNPRAFKDGKNVFSKTDDPYLENKIKEAGAENETFLIDKDVSLLDRIIVLPMPDSVQSSLDANTEAKSNSAIDAAMSDPFGAAAAAGKKVATDAASGATGIAGDILIKKFAGGKDSLVASGIKDIASDVSDQTKSYADTLLRNSGYVTNDRKEMWFEGMDFRRFSFSYTFSPRSKQESELLQEVIRTLRFYMLPTYSGTGTSIAGKFFLIQPAEFEMKFMIADKENTSIPKMDRCLLKSCAVNYTPRDKWVMLDNGDGFPPEIELKLEFVEKQLMFREKVFRENGNSLLGGF